MTGCSQAGCLNTDIKVYKKFIGHGLTPLCGTCASALQAIGMSLTPVERREHDVTPVVERRHAPRPEWLSRLTARSDESWRVA